MNIRDTIIIMPQPVLEEPIHDGELVDEGFVDLKGKYFKQPGKRYKWVGKVRGVWCWSLTNIGDPSGLSDQHE